MIIFLIAPVIVLENKLIQLYEIYVYIVWKIILFNWWLEKYKV